MQPNSTNPSNETSNVDPTPAETPIAETLTLEVLKIVKEAQQQHGLRHLDYQRYRSFCTRRIRRLRKTLHFVCGNMKRYQKREPTVDDLTDVKFLMIPLFQAERAWSYANQLKQESNTEPRKRFHLINRLRKAIKYSTELEKLSQSSKCDARTKLEAQGYSSLINGQFFFETQKWDESLRHFNIAQKIYEKLAAALKGDDSQVFYLQKVEEITPNIRYCNYNLGDETAKKDLIDMMLKSPKGSELAENIDTLISQTKEKQVITFSEVVWRNNITLQIKNEKVRLFLSNVQDYEKQIQSSTNFDVKISIYENIVKESVETIQIVRDELKLDPLFQQMQRGLVLSGEEKPSNLLLLFGYLTWTRINKNIERNLLLLESYKAVLNKQPSSGNSAGDTEDNKIKNAKPQDLVRLYDIILQNHKDLSALPGLVSDKKFLADNELLISFYRTFRAYYIGLYYLSNKRYKEAIGFSFKVESYIKSVQDNLNSLSKNSDLEKSKKDLLNQISQLQNELNQSKYKIQTAAILEDDTNDDADLKEQELNKDKLLKTPLVNRLETYLEDSNLCTNNPNVVKLPLSYEPIPCKPLFFDLALNHLELPSLEDKIDSKKTQQQTGIKGFFKGFFGK